MLRPVDPHLQRALAAIDGAERDVAAAGPIEITSEYARDIAAAADRPKDRLFLAAHAAALRRMLGP